MVDPGTGQQSDAPDLSVSGDVIAEFTEIIRALRPVDDLYETLQIITNTAIEVVPGCDVASVTVVEGDGFATLGPTAQIADDIDAVQYEAGEGPCIDATGGQLIVTSSNVTVDERWPAFAGQFPQDSPVRSMLSCGLTVRNDEVHHLGGLNLYGFGTDAFGPVDHPAALLFASFAAIVLDAADRMKNLRLAMETREVIGQAMGMLMERGRLTASEAFSVLKARSQDENVKLRDIAVHMTRDAELAAGGSTDGQGGILD